MSKFGIPEGQDPEKTAALFAALAAAQHAAGDVSKDATNKHHGYSYASAESVLGEKHALNQHGLTLLPMGYEQRPSEMDEFWTDLDRVYWLTHSAGGYLIVSQLWMYQPSKGRPWDKALAAGLTSSLGYEVRDVLGIARVAEGDDISGRDDRDYDPRDRAPAKPRQSKPAEPTADEVEEGRRTAAGWLHDCPPIDASKEDRRAYIEAAKAAGLGELSLRCIGARLWSMANIAAGALDEEGMSEGQSHDLGVAKELLGAYPDETRALSSDEPKPERQAGPETSSEEPDVKQDEPPDDPVEKAAADLAAAKAKPAKKPKPKAKPKAKAEAKPAEDEGQPFAPPDESATPPDEEPEPAKANGKLWDLKTQVAKLSEFLSYIEGSPTPEDFSKLARGPRMQFDEKHLTVLDVAIELRQAKVESRDFDASVCTPELLADLRSIVDGPSASV